MAKSFLDVDFNIRGYNRVRNQLRLMASIHPRLTDPIIEKHTKRTSSLLRNKRYPNELPNQKYQRTGELGRRFRAQHRGAGRWAIINRRKGAVWVIKKGMQNRAYHLGRWWTIDDEAQKEMPKLTRDLSQALEKELDNA